MSAHVPPLLPKYVYGVLGMPLTQSLSPALHNWAFARSGHPGAYFAFEKSAEELPALFQAVRALPVSGLSVTIPHKKAVMPFLDEITPGAQTVGAVNLVYWQEGRLIGDNTDVAGFLAPLRKLLARGVSLPPATLLLGAGGACRAALAGLLQLGASEIYLSARSAEKAGALAGEFGCRTLAWEKRDAFAADIGPVLVINATPLGMLGTFEEQTPLPGLALPGRAPRPGSIAYDIVYNPVATPFLKAAAAAGLVCVDGLEFFLAQACEQFRIWTGQELPTDEARELLLGLLENARHRLS